MRNAVNFAIVALIALAFAFVPSGKPTLNVVLSLLGIAFFVAIAFFGYRLYREHRFTLESLESNERLVLYGSIGVAMLAFVAWFGVLTGAGVLIGVALLVAASFGVYWVLTHSRRYD